MDCCCSMLSVTAHLFFEPIVLAKYSPTYEYTGCSVKHVKKNIRDPQPLEAMSAHAITLPLCFLWMKLFCYGSQIVSSLPTAFFPHLSHLSNHLSLLSFVLHWFSCLQPMDALFHVWWEHLFVTGLQKQLQQWRKCIANKRTPYLLPT